MFLTKKLSSIQKRAYINVQTTVLIWGIPIRILQRIAQDIKIPNNCFSKNTEGFECLSSMHIVVGLSWNSILAKN